MLAPTQPRCGEMPSVANPTVPATVEHIFRHESGRIVATLVRLLRDVDVAEEIAQDALVVALEKWPFSGVPENPGAWLMVAARNAALDYLRRAKGFDSKREAIGWQQELQQSNERGIEDTLGTIADDQLRLMFTCCHPALSRESQVALTLRLMGGLATPEIARAFLVSEATIAQRIVRAKRTISELGLPYEVPASAELPARLPSVLEVVYLIFNEGYTAASGDNLVRAELSGDAIRLGALLAGLMPHEPEVLGLLALMQIQSSRTAARTGPDGALVVLAEQDRSRWDRGLIERGFEHLQRANALARRGPYQVQAAIAACHALAASFDQTDWRAVANLYAELQHMTPSPVIEINRAVAVSMVDGPVAGLAILDVIASDGPLSEYHLLPSVRADFLRRLERWNEAVTAYTQALALTNNGSEQEFLRRRIEECTAARRIQRSS